MRRRMTDVHTGLGNPSPDIFDNQWTNNEEFNNAARAFFDDILKDVKDFKELGSFDFSMTLKDDGFRILFGLEPTYKHDPYICYCFEVNSLWKKRMAQCSHDCLYPAAYPHLAGFFSSDPLESGNLYYCVFVGDLGCSGSILQRS